MNNIVPTGYQNKAVIVPDDSVWGYDSEGVANVNFLFSTILTYITNNLTTSGITEGTNLYYTPARVVADTTSKADKANVLELDNTTTFTPDADYEPATKKYVDDEIIKNVSSKFGGTGSDGAISGALTVTGSNDTYIVKNYSTFTPGANTVTITPTNCILHIKVSGDCDLTGTTFDFASKGGVGGAGGARVPDSDGDPGAVGSIGLSNQSIHTPEGGNFGGGGTSSFGTGGASSTVPFIIKGDFLQSSRLLSVTTGAGGGGGGAGEESAVGGTAGDGGAGGDGGGCVILEVKGNIVFSSTTINNQGGNGVDGVDASGGNNNGGGGAGGGGAGGVFICLYNGTITGLSTPNVSGGTGGDGGSNEGSGKQGGGGSGGASGMGSSVAGSDGSAITGGGAGGNAANGFYIIEKNITFS